MSLRPVLYLDLDDTILSWETGSPRPVEHTREFLLWALDRFEVRWLTRWARDGRMESGLLNDLARMTGVDVERLRTIEGLDWGGAGSKLDGIAWVEHVVLERPFVWLEEGLEHGQADVLRAAEMHGCFHRCNVTEDAAALAVARDTLLERFGDPRAGAA